STQGICPVAFESLENGLAVDEAPVLVNGVEPEQEAQLLQRELPGAPLMAKPAGAPAGDLPAERVLGEQPVALVVRLPGRADLDRLVVLIRQVHQVEVNQGLHLIR